MEIVARPMNRLFVRSRNIVLVDEVSVEYWSGDSRIGETVNL